MAHSYGPNLYIRGELFIFCIATYSARSALAHIAALTPTNLKLAYCVLRPTQPPILSGTGNEYQPMDSDALRLGVTAGRTMAYVLLQVKLCDLFYNMCCT